MVWLAPLGSRFTKSFQSPFSVLPPRTFPTELVLEVGPLTSVPLEGQIALDKNCPFALPSALAART